MTAPSPAPGHRAWLRAAIALVLFLVFIGVLVTFDPDDLYLWIKSLHIIAVVAWMAGLLYLPRLFVYHVETKPGSEASEIFKVMEARLIRIIMNPAMMLTWIFGLTLAWTVFRFQGGWLHAKLLGVVVLTGVHIYFTRAQRAFARDERPKSQRHWRILNEVPAMLLIFIVLMVVLKPF